MSSVLWSNWHFPLAWNVFLWYRTPALKIKLYSTEDFTVAGTCDICGKGKLSGNKVSHANNRSKKFSKPNLQPIRAVGSNGSHVRMHVCTRCIRSGKVQKVS